LSSQNRGFAVVLIKAGFGTGIIGTGNNKTAIRRER
jgi:hypothetical protein